MNSEVKEKNKLKEKRLIRLNKTKIVLVSTLIFLILFGTILGIYFAIKNRGGNVLLPKRNIEWVSNSKSVRNRIEKKEGKDVFTGVYFGNKDSEISQLLLYSTTESSEQNDLNGIFSEFLEKNVTSIDWLGVNYSSGFNYQNQIDDLFIKKNDSKDVEFYDDSFYYLGEPSNKWNQTGFNDMYFEKIDVNAIDNPDSSTDLNVEFLRTGTINSTGSKTPSPYGESSFLPTWMWFHGSDLIFVAQGAPVNENTDDDGSVSTPEIDFSLTEDFFVQMEDYLISDFDGGILTKP